MESIRTKTRIDIIDALRGFALAGIVIVHMAENYVGGPVPQIFISGTHQVLTDNIVDGVINLLLRGKFFALFSFLFGLSFYIQMHNAAQKEKNYAWRFLWRIIILLGIGLLHHALYKGDILSIYAVLAIFLIPFRTINNKWILILAGLLFLGLGRYIVFAITGDGGIFGPVSFKPDDPEVFAYYDIIKNGSFLDVIKVNATDGQRTKWDFQLGLLSRAYLTFGFFLLGLYAGRIRFFEKFRENAKFLKRTLIWSIILLVVSFGIAAGFFVSAGPDVQFNNWPIMFGLTGFDIFNFFMTLIIIVLFVMAYRSNKGERRLKVFAPYGRMALTNYVMQTVIGTFLFFGWGLGYLGEILNSYSFLLALLIIIVQVWLSKWWLSKFNYGPLEWLWRSLTYFKWFPFRKT